MSAMGSERHRHGHPLSEPNHFAAPTLPSVAEMLSSSNDAVYHRPGDFAPVPPNPSASRTPPTVHPLSAPANPPTAPAPSAWTAVNHASSHVSPTNTRPTMTTPQHHRHSRSAAQPALPPLDAALSSNSSLSLHDAAFSQRPNLSQHQDPATSQQRGETGNVLRPSAPSSDSSPSYFNPTLSDDRQSISPRPNSHSTSSNSPLPSPLDPRASQVPSHFGAQATRRGHSKSTSSGIQSSADYLRSHDLGSGSLAPGNTESGPRSTLAAAVSDQTSSSGTRQQRFHVRFGHDYTSENMSPSQKLRSDPAPSVPAFPDESDARKAALGHPVTTTVEPSTVLTNPIYHPPEDHSSNQSRRRDRDRDPSPERCLGCNEVWKRPLPKIDTYRHKSPAETISDSNRAHMTMSESLKDHGKMADAMYIRWKHSHSRCLPFESDSVSMPSQPSTEPQPSNKRKLDVLHDDDDDHHHQKTTPKLRKVTFDSPPTAGPSLGPFAPA